MVFVALSIAGGAGAGAGTLCKRPAEDSGTAEVGNGPHLGHPLIPQSDHSSNSWASAACDFLLTAHLSDGSLGLGEGNSRMSASSLCW